MNDTTLTRLFLRYRSRHDGRALALVFDATARELLGVAAHLVRDANEAEDLVQITFQVAIERAASFDAEQSLKGWLYGILWREAAKLRRNAARVIDPDRLASAASSEPIDRLMADEVPSAVADALHAIPSPYREVVEPLLLEGRSASEIARELRRAPGTVRVQIQRGLERLRKSLPQGLGLAAFAIRPRGLDAVRKTVLEHAGFAPATLPVSAGAALVAQSIFAGGALTPLAWTGGLLGASLLAIAHPWSASGQLRDAVHETHRVVAAATPAGERVQGTASAVAFEAASSAALGRRSLERSSTDVVDADVTGTVVDESGVGVSEVLVHARRREGDDRVIRADSNGRFAFDGLGTGWWFFSVDDERFARVWWLENGVDLPVKRDAKPLVIGLHRPRSLDAVVVDEAGEPVSDVGVRLAVEWIEGSKLPVQGHLTDTVQTTRTGADGRFAMHRLRPGKMQIVLDHPRFARTVVSVPVPDASGRLTIQNGLRLEGEVVADGRPIPGIVVHADATHESHLSMGTFKTATDASGRFVVEHIHSFGPSAIHGVPTIALSIDDPRWTSGRYSVFETPRGELPFVSIHASVRADSAAELPNTDVGRDLAREAGARGEPYGTATIRLRLAAHEGDSSTETPEGVVVCVGRMSPSGKVVSRTAHLDAKASAIFEHLPAADYRINIAGVSGRCYLPQNVHLDDADDREVVIETGTSRLRGRVRCGDEACAGMRVQCRPIGFSSSVSVAGASTKTDVEGVYEIRGLVPGRYGVTVWPPRESKDFANEFDAQVTEADSVRDFELPVGSIDGRLAGVELPPHRSNSNDLGRIRIFPSNKTPESGNLGVFVDPDETGAFRARFLAPGSYVVWFVDAAGRTRRRAVTIDALHAHPSVVFDADEDVGAISCNVAGLASSSDDADAKLGITRCTVTAYPCDANGPDITVGYGGRLDEKTGECRIDNVPPGTYGVMFAQWRTGAASLWVPGVRVLTSKTTEMSAVRVSTGRQVRIKLVSGDTIPARAVWRLRMQNGDWLPSVLFVGSDAEGRRSPETSFGLPLGDYLVRADFGDERPVEREFHLDDGHEVVEIVVSRP